MTSTVLHKMPVATRRLIANPRNMEIKQEDHYIAESRPIAELRSGKLTLPLWAEGLFDNQLPGQPRRRRRLTHLSAEEKILRRKLKNRVAAQNARDKKRSETETLKKENEELRELINQFQHQNRSAHEMIARLEDENKELRVRLGAEKDVDLVPMDCEEKTVGSPLDVSTSLSDIHPSGPNTSPCSGIDAGSSPAAGVAGSAPSGPQNLRIRIASQQQVKHLVSQRRWKQKRSGTPRKIDKKL